ncbi:MAG: hypothetical protein AAF989_01465 [Planctomycetota bacterium]
MMPSRRRAARYGITSPADAMHFVRPADDHPVRLFGFAAWTWCFVFVGAMITLGCDSPAAIRTYSIPTAIPAQLQPSAQRIMAAMVPIEDQVWFYKIKGPESALGVVEDQFSEFVRTMVYEKDVPRLNNLPEGWRRGADKPFRHASVDIDTEDKQLDLSISKLGASEDWDAFVVMNVNRWRKQLGLSDSTEPRAGGKVFEVDATDRDAIWVDIVGEPGAEGGSMGGPMMGSQMMGATNARPGQGAAAGPAADPHAFLPAETRAKIASGELPLPDGKPATASTKKSPLDYERPEGWSDGKLSMMRLAAFETGQGDDKAEITVISAGGDLRSNVKRWMGQVIGKTPEDDRVDQILADAEKRVVGGRDAQRFLLTDDDVESAIDATIIPLENGFSMFVKMTGPKSTVVASDKEMSSFLDSLSF